MPSATRLIDGPIITGKLFEQSGIVADGQNINGPSLIRKPEWIDGRGTYWMYFAHHSDRYIRLATADNLTGPYTLLTGGTLQLEQTHFRGHIASPDVHVDDVNKTIIMYYHGCCRADPAVPWSQITCVATSTDGVNFVSRRETLGPSYMRMFQWRGRHYGIAKPGLLFTSEDGLTDFKPGPRLVHDKARHFATLVQGDVLHLFYSRIGDCPERIIHRKVGLLKDWSNWQASEATDVLSPEHPWEGSDAPQVGSTAGLIVGPAYQLRDPAIFVEGDQYYLIYCGSGESNIAIAKLDL